MSSRLPVLVSRRTCVSLVAVDDELVVGLEALPDLPLLRRRRADDSDLEAERLAELDRDMAEPGQPHNAKAPAAGLEHAGRFGLHRVVHRDAGATAVAGCRIRTTNLWCAMIMFELLVMRQS
jgi:hypothetical protein